MDDNMVNCIIIGLALYIALLNINNINLFIINLFNNSIFRIFILFFIFIIGNENPILGIMIAIAFVLTLDYIYVSNIIDKPKYVKKDNKSNCGCNKK
jgi:hypothetical protein